MTRLKDALIFSALVQILQLWSVPKYRRDSTTVIGLKSDSIRQIGGLKKIVEITEEEVDMIYPKLSTQCCELWRVQYSKIHVLRLLGHRITILDRFDWGNASIDPRHC